MALPDSDSHLDQLLQRGFSGHENRHRLRVYRESTSRFDVHVAPLIVAT
jgi:hypothetical protein